MNDVIVFRASSAGDCMTALVAHAMGVERAPMPKSLDKALDDGRRNEGPILAAYQAQTGRRLYDVGDFEALGIPTGRDEGYADYSGQAQVRMTVAGGKAVIQAHLDGIAADRERRVIVEAKAFGDALWDQFKRGGLAAFEHYAWQTSVQQYALQEVLGLDTPPPLDFYVGHKDENGDVWEFEREEVGEPLIPLARIKARYGKAVTVAAKGVLPECDTPRWPCGYYFLAEHPDTPERAEVEDQALEAAVRTYHAAKQVEKEAKAKYEAAKKVIADHFAAQGAEQKITVGGFDVTWVEKNMPERTMPASVQRYPLVKQLEATAMPDEPDWVANLRSRLKGQG